MLLPSGEKMQLKMGDNWRLLGDTKINNDYEHKSREDSFRVVGDKAIDITINQLL